MDAGIMFSITVFGAVLSIEYYLQQQQQQQHSYAIINEGNYKSRPLPNTLSALFVSTITNQGTITHLGAGFKLSDVLANSGTLVVSFGTLFKNEWIINNSGIIDSDGTNNNANATVTKFGTVNNGGTLINNSTITVNDFAEINRSGDIGNASDIFISDTLDVSGGMVNTGTISADSRDDPEGDEIIISGVGSENSGGTIILDFDAILENSAIVNNTNDAVFDMTNLGAVLNGGIFISQNGFMSFVNGSAMQSFALIAVSNSDLLVENGSILQGGGMQRHIWIYQ